MTCLLAMLAGSLAIVYLAISGRDACFLCTYSCWQKGHMNPGSFDSSWVTVRVKLPVQLLLAFILWSCPAVRDCLGLSPSICLCASKSLIRIAPQFRLQTIFFSSLMVWVGFSLCLIDGQPLWFGFIEEEFLSCAWPVFLLCACAYCLSILVILDHFSGFLLA